MCRHAAEFCCNGNVVEDSELGHVIQLQGDQRKNVSGFLVANKLAKKVRPPQGGVLCCVLHLYS